jgi:hypothetical protein
MVPNSGQPHTGGLVLFNYKDCFRCSGRSLYIIPCLAPCLCLLQGSVFVLATPLLQRLHMHKIGQGVQAWWLATHVAYRACLGLLAALWRDAEHQSLGTTAADAVSSLCGTC